MITVKQAFIGLSILTLSQISMGLSVNNDMLKHSPAQCKTHYNGTILQHPTDCHKFFVCVNSQAQEYNCESNFHFDMYSRSCVTGSECSNSNGLPQKPLCKEGAVKAVADDCYIFETCVNGQYQKLNCPSGFYFYAPHGVCKPIQINAHFKCNCMVPEHAVLQNKDNCQTYYVCKGRKPLLNRCAEGEYYESSVNSCLPDLEGVCVMKPTRPPPKSHAEYQAELLIKMGAQKLCENKGQGIISFSSFEGSCNKFQICLNGQLYTNECPEGFSYNDSKKNCVLDTENICQSGSSIKDTQTVEEKENLAPQKPQSVNDFKEQTNIIPPHHVPELTQGINKVFSKFMKL